MNIPFGTSAKCTLDHQCRLCVDDRRPTCVRWEWCNQPVNVEIQPWINTDMVYTFVVSKYRGYFVGFIVRTALSHKCIGKKSTGTRVPPLLYIPVHSVQLIVALKSQVTLERIG